MKEIDLAIHPGDTIECRDREDMVDTMVAPGKGRHRDKDKGQRKIRPRSEGGRPMKLVVTIEGPDAASLDAENTAYMIFSQLDDEGYDVTVTAETVED